MIYDGKKWWLNSGGYYMRVENKKKILLHRYKMEKKLGRKLVPGEIVDHFDGNRQNNDDDNLRVVSFHENIINQKSRGKIPARGIIFEESSGKFRARICFNYQRIHIGRFKTLDEAKNAYKAKAKELYDGVANENLFST